MSILATFDFNFATTEPHTADVVQFDIYLHIWDKRDDRTIYYTSTGGDLVLKAESCCLVEDDLGNFEFGTMFRVRMPNGKLKLCAKRERFSCALVASGSGGNWYWTTNRVPMKRWAHLFNWLRRRKGSSVTEWQTEFLEWIWRKHGPIRRADIKNYIQWWVRTTDPDARHIKFHQ